MSVDQQNQKTNETVTGEAIEQSRIEKFKERFSKSSSKNKLQIGISAMALLFIGGVGFGALSNPTGPLSWSPPELNNPRVVHVPQSGYFSVSLGDNEDARIVFPETKRVGATAIKGGRNIIIIGGHLTVERDTSTSDKNKRAIYIADAKGTVHIEGVLIDSSGGGDSDGISINAPEAIVQIQNSRVVDLWGRQDRKLGTHADIVQVWGGVRELRMDRFTGSGDYQGLEIKDDVGNVRSAIIKNTNIIGNYPDTSVQKLDSSIKGGYLLTLQWFSCPDTHGVVPKYSFDNVYINPRSDRGSDPQSSLSRSVTPNESGCRLQFDTNDIDRTTLSWNTSTVDGEITHGLPTAGDFVPEGVAGIGYESPGYQNGGSVDPIDDQNPEEPTPEQNPDPSYATEDDHINCGDIDAVICEKFENNPGIEQARGSWEVIDGTLRSSEPETVDIGNGAIALLDQEISGEYEAKFSAQVIEDNEFDDVSFIFDYRDEGNYKFVSLNEQNDDATSGVFEVIEGEASQIEDVELELESNEWVLVSIERGDSSIRVVVDGQEVANTAMLPTKDLNVGFGSRNNDVLVDYLVIEDVAEDQDEDELGEEPVEESPDDSDSAEDSSFQGLSPGGMVMGDTIFVSYEPGVEVSSVKFYVNDSFVNSESVAPYYLGGDTGVTPNGYDISGLTDGDHTISVRYTPDGGSEQRDSITFEKLGEQDTGPVSGEGFEGLADGAVVSGQIPVTYTPANTNDVRKVKFYIDGSFESSESVAPYSLAGDSGGTVFAWDTEQLANGQHTVRAKTEYKSGESSSVTITINVQN